MKKVMLFVLVLVFAVNTVSLAAYASVCVRMTVEKTQEMASMPDCHKKVQENQTKGHCKGICFCQHVQANQNIVPFDPVTINHIFERQIHWPFEQKFSSSLHTMPLLRPPISIS